MKPYYVTPRIAIANLTSFNDIQLLQQTIQLKHKQYYHLFNLSNVKLPEGKQSGFKWRGFPFSITQIVKMITQIDTFLRMNGANAAIICVSNPQMEAFAKKLVKIYLQICLASLSDSQEFVSLVQVTASLPSSHPYLHSQMAVIYKSIKIKQPPIIFLESFLTIPETFIPITDVSTEGRYNDFQHIYHHSIQDQLVEYYVNLNKPLQTGIGKKYYDQKPQTKYFKQPIQVCGDVKIVVSSFESLNKKQQFSAGFNTLNIGRLNKNNTLRLTYDDLYQVSQRIPKDIVIELTFSYYFDGESNDLRPSQAGEYRQQTKKFINRYADTQNDLQKLNRKRTKQQLRYMLAL